VYKPVARADNLSPDISGNWVRVASETARAASPMISTRRTTASLRISSLSRIDRPRPTVYAIAFSAASRMCRGLAASPGGSAGIAHLSLALNLLAEVSAQRAGRVQIDGVTDHLRELILESGESEARNVALFEFDENIDIAVGSKIGTQYRPKEG